MFDDLLGNGDSFKQTGGTVSTATIKAWAFKHWNLPSDATLLVSELQCGETDCPDMETIIAILSVADADKTVKFNKSIHEIKESDIRDIDIWHRKPE